MSLSRFFHFYDQVRIRILKFRIFSLAFKIKIRFLFFLIGLGIFSLLVTIYHLESKFLRQAQLEQAALLHSHPSLEYFNYQERILRNSLFLIFGLITGVLFVAYWMMTRLSDSVSGLMGEVLREKRRADLIADSISDGVILFYGQEIVYTNPIARKIIIYPEQGDLFIQAVRRAISQTLPVEFTFESENRRRHFLLQSFDLPAETIEKMEMYRKQGSGVLFEKSFLADGVVLAQDVTLVKESQEAKSHFLGTLSHEIKTPVTSLTMATRLLKKSSSQISNPSLQHLIHLCVDDVDRLRGLLEELLNVSQFDMLAQNLEIKSADVAKLIHHSVRSFQLEAGKKGIELTFNNLSPTKAVYAPVDASKIAWAFSNLMTNALRHTPRGGKVYVQFLASMERIEVKVRDTGPGIEHSRKHQIFEKFKPTYDLRIARSGSVGAGLAIARDLVIAHGGRIWVNSEVGQGAEFGFTIPVRGRGQPYSSSDRVSGDRVSGDGISGAGSSGSKTGTGSGKGGGRVFVSEETSSHQLKAESIC